MTIKVTAGDEEGDKVLDNVRAAIKGLSPGRSAGILLLAMIEIANKEHWSASRLLAWFCQAVAIMDPFFKYELGDEVEGKMHQ